MHELTFQSEKFVAYIMYCSNHTGALAKLQQSIKSSKDMRHFLEELQKSNVLRQLDLNSYLLKPVQRICKYPLLIKVRERQAKARISINSTGNLETY